MTLERARSFQFPVWRLLVPARCLLLHGNSPCTAEAGSCPEPTSLDLGDCGSVEAATRLAAPGSRNPARVRDAGVGAAACAQPQVRARRASAEQAVPATGLCPLPLPEGPRRARRMRGAGEGLLAPRSLSSGRSPSPAPPNFFLFFLFFSHFEADRLAVPRLGSSPAHPPSRVSRGAVGTFQVARLENAADVL